jgi:hypothetical protein
VLLHVMLMLMLLMLLLNAAACVVQHGAVVGRRPLPLTRRRTVLAPNLPRLGVVVLVLQQQIVQ